MQASNGLKKVRVVIWHLPEDVGVSGGVGGSFAKLPRSPEKAPRQSSEQHHRQPMWNTTYRCSQNANERQAECTT